MRRLTPVLLASLLCSASAFAVDDVATEGRASTNARKKLAAAESKAEAPQNPLFDQLIGTWDVRYEFTDKNGKLRSNRGQVHYSWILGGKALQETWTSVPIAVKIRCPHDAPPCRKRRTIGPG
jgi:hypothetical protein